MIALDSSAIVAVARDEPERKAFADLIASNQCLVGAPTAFESHMVLRDRMGEEGIVFLQALLSRRQVRVIVFDAALLAIAQFTFDRYGKKRHPAELNFADCMAYAVAKANDVPLLYKGAGFAKTDIRPALP